ncbi:MAG TPA: transglutaminase domain-containing protein [Thermoanaerobaculia bacterium]|jgi:transglutaminase-like putative cysteine protease|nr:transglutaminase domain-containing protein [Thermoanaerobaculia bacterium]
MRRIALTAAAFFAATLASAATAPKSYDATYLATVSGIPEGVKELKVWIPLPVTRGAQTVSNVVIDSPYAFRRHKDAELGNEYAYATIAHPPAGDLRVKVRFSATRREEVGSHPFETAASRAELARALKADRLVTLSPRVRKLADEVTAGKSGTMEEARAIYEHLITTMKYDKTEPGWGKGDTERACDVRKGNCTDFHSLFMSLARAKGIPARFIIGFPLTAADGDVKGYHCWSEFYVKGKGWIPVDASDASKSSDPAVRAYLFGNLDPNRVQFTVGRDLTLTPKTSQPLNFFIYPRAEADGQEIGTPAISLQFRELAPAAVTGR